MKYTYKISVSVGVIMDVEADSDEEAKKKAEENGLQFLDENSLPAEVEIIQKKLT